MNFGTPFKPLSSRQCRRKGALCGIHRHERASVSRHPRCSAGTQDPRLPHTSTPAVSRIDHRRATKVNAVREPPLLGTNKGLTVHLDVEYVQLLGLHLGESSNGSKILTAFESLSAEKIEEGYSTRAMAGRQQLLEEAKEFALKSVGKKISVENTKGIDLATHLVPGAMSILTEVEEYDIVILVGNKILESPGMANMKRDILLSMALAKLGQAEYYFTVPNQVAMACRRMDEALQLLTKGGSPQLAPGLCKQIEDALETYVPQCVLDQLKLPLNTDNVKGRKDADSILKGLLAVPRRTDYALIGVDRHYVKQVMDCLTSEEVLDVVDWTTVLSDPKCVKWYYPGLLLKAATVHIVVGFSQRRPALVRSMDNILSMPGKDREAHVEHVICKLLLGEVEKAFYILEKIEGGKVEEDSSELYTRETEAMVVSSKTVASEHNLIGAKVMPGRNETLAFIKAHSDDGKDSLSGLCLFFERWIQHAGFPQFRDTATGRPSPSLTEYFQDRKVANMLNTSPASRNGLFDLISLNKKDDKKKQRMADTSPTMNGSRPPSHLDAVSYSGSSTRNEAMLFPVAHPVGKPQLRRPRTLWMALLCGTALGTAVFGVIRASWLPLTKLGTESNPAVAEVRQDTTGRKQGPAVKPVNGKRRKKSGPVLPLRKVDAEKLVQKWQFAKAEALGKQHEFKYMHRVLADPMLETWTNDIQEAADRGLYWKYKLENCKITQIDTAHLHEENGYVGVTVSLKESAVMYGRDGKEMDRYKSRYNIDYRVIVDDEGRWKINYVKVLPQNA